ncbi:hypothetical protein [Caballeronia sp. LZ001]|uniref:hypothetical protein n=1 Tax=Caballeronia sp. LZ001 TaxID=3038553 RepID=UPI0028612D5C|nr:hypothetical protein [Caballeronia sp. LZ001]MDR5806706.1 hypothetical protein [Caballeronia sp. LZ001]
MYQLSFSGSAHSFRTMLEVLRYLRDDASVAAVDAAEIALTFVSHALSVTRYNGKLTVRRPGTATSLFLSLIDEIDAAYFRPSFATLEAWQIRREHWQLLYLAFDLAREPLYLFSSDQVAQANEEAAKSGRRGLDLFEVQTADMSYLLSILDRPDDANRATKQSVREVFGIKLIGVRAAARRRGIFQLAGMDAAQQAEWEALSVSQREARRVAREVARAREAAEIAHPHARRCSRDRCAVGGADDRGRLLADRQRAAGDQRALRAR